MKVRSFRELHARIPVERRAANEAWAKKTLAEMPLHELRAARQMTQEHLAQILGVNQAAISKMERRADMYISTLAKFIEAMGGKLEVRAAFPDGVVVLERLGKEKDAA